MRLPYNSSLSLKLTFVFRAVVVSFDSAMASSFSILSKPLVSVAIT
jgi:hypothetical protein